MAVIWLTQNKWYKMSIDSKCEPPNPFNGSYSLCECIINATLKLLFLVYDRNHSAIEFAIRNDRFRWRVR